MNKAPLGAIIAGLLIAVGAEVAKVGGWGEALTPLFVGTLMVQIGGVGAAVWGAIKYQSGGGQ
jgi:hypothetical protein